MPDEPELPIIVPDRITSTENLRGGSMENADRIVFSLIFAVFVVCAVARLAFGYPVDKPETSFEHFLMFATIAFYLGAVAFGVLGGIFGFLFTLEVLNALSRRFHGQTFIGPPIEDEIPEPQNDPEEDRPRVFEVD